MKLKMRDTSGSVWDWQLETRTMSDGAVVPLGPDPSFRVLFEHQLVVGQGEDSCRPCFYVCKLKTGIVGYIQFYVHTVEKVPLVDSQGNIVKSIYHGHVELTWEEEGESGK